MRVLKKFANLFDKSTEAVGDLKFQIFYQVMNMIIVSYNYVAISHIFILQFVHMEIHAKVK